MNFIRCVSYVALGIIWVLVSGSVTIGNFLLGLLFSTVILYCMRNMFTFTTKPSEFFRTLPQKIVYSGVLLKEIVKANIDVGRRILQPKINVRPGIIAYPYRTQHDMSTTMLANTITLTPGTLVIDIHEDKKSKDGDYHGVLYVHCIDMENPKDVRDSIYDSIEKYVLEAFE